VGSAGRGFRPVSGGRAATFAPANCALSASSRRPPRSSRSLGYYRGKFRATCILSAFGDVVCSLLLKFLVIRVLYSDGRSFGLSAGVGRTHDLHSWEFL